MSAEVIRFPKKSTDIKPAAENTLKKMVKSPGIKQEVKRIIGGMGDGYEFEYHGPKSTIHTDNGFVDLRYGRCDVISKDSSSWLVVHDSFPLALEDLGIDGEASWQTAAIFAGLKEAIHARAIWPGSDFSRIVTKAKDVDFEKGLWRMSEVNARIIALNRVAASLALEEIGILPGMLSCEHESPYPSHIAAFVDPIYTKEVL